MRHRPSLLGLHAAAALAALAAAGPVVIVDDQPQRRSEPTPPSPPAPASGQPTTFDAERIRLAAMKRARKAARRQHHSKGA